MTDTSWRVWREADHVDMSDRRAVAADLATHMRDFLSFRDVSPAFVSHIEGLLDTFAGEEWHEDVEEAVALYEPWGGSDANDHLLTARELGRVFEVALPFIENEAT